MHGPVSNVLLLPLALFREFQFSPSHPGGRDKGFPGLKEEFTVISPAIEEWQYLYDVVDSLEDSLQNGQIRQDSP